MKILKINLNNYFNTYEGLKEAFMCLKMGEVIDDKKLLKQIIDYENVFD